MPTWSIWCARVAHVSCHARLSLIFASVSVPVARLLPARRRAQTTLDEHSMMDNLRVRFDGGEVYTTCGRIVVSVNPFRWLDLYGEDRVVRYHSSEDPFATLPPHVYSITHAALHEVAVQASRGQAMRACTAQPRTRDSPHSPRQRGRPTLGGRPVRVCARRLTIHSRLWRVRRGQDRGDEDLHALPRRGRRPVLRRRDVDRPRPH